MQWALLKQLRTAGIACEIYHETAKMDKQFKYADKKNIPFVVIIGSKELEQQSAVVKNITTGNQQIVPFIALPGFFSELNQ